MARQFYTTTVVSTSEPVVIHFEKAVRKIYVSVLSNFVALSVGTAIDTSKMLILGLHSDGMIDFQSANTGKGVQDLALLKYGAEGGARVCISVVEYGSDGDNEFFK